MLSQYTIHILLQYTLPFLDDHENNIESITCVIMCSKHHGNQGLKAWEITGVRITTQLKLAIDYFTHCFIASSNSEIHLMVCDVCVRGIQVYRYGNSTCLVH